MRTIFFLLIFTFFFIKNTAAQKKTLQIFSESESIETIRINTDEVFRIELKATSTSAIKVESFSEGEYAQAIGINTNLQNHTLQISSNYQQILASGYDKLSAHKVFAVVLKIEIPANKRVIITSNLASVYAEGNYSFLEAELSSGRCELKHFNGNAIINTVSGDILINTYSGNIKATSHHGIVDLPKFYSTGNKITAKTIYGDIIVKKIQ